MAETRAWGTDEPQVWCNYCGTRCYPVSLKAPELQDKDAHPSPKLHLHCCIECAKVVQAVLASANFSERPRW